MSEARRPGASSTPPAVHVVDGRAGWQLRVFDYRPTREPCGVVVAGHAMMVDGRTMCRSDRLTLGSTLVEAGYRVLVPDQRGHGQSGPTPREGGNWSYDDLVADVGSYVELARSLEPGRPLILLGHSLFGHASLAWLGMNPDAPVSSLVCLGVEVWNRRFERSRLRWLIKRLSYSLGTCMVRLVGRLPARALRQGSADESRGFWLQFHGFVRDDRWGSRDRQHDYWAGLASIEQPVLFMVSENDRFYCRPRSALAFTSTLPRRQTVVIGRDDAPSPLDHVRPTHMGLVTDPNSELVWKYVARWLSAGLCGADHRAL